MTQAHIKFWNERGLDFIVPPATDNPEGFDIAEVLLPLCHGEVLEIGCGTGRIAQLFDGSKYRGFDINEAAVKKAKERLPHHIFIHGHQMPRLYKKVDTVLLYTVCLHIPDALIRDQLSRAADNADRIVIAEIMNPAYRSNRNAAAEYDISNQRSLAQYIDTMAGIGFHLSDAVTRPYKHYEGEVITFAVFER